MARKKNEAEEVLAPDPFLDAAHQGAAFFEKHGKTLLIAAGVVFAGIVGGEFLMKENAREASALTGALSGAIKSYEEATDLRTVLTSTSAAKTNKAYEEARSKFEAFRNSHPNTGAARLASVYEADLLRRLGKHADAAARYQVYLDGADPKDPLRFMALEGAGYALEADQQLDQALEKYRQLGESGAYVKDYALKHQARVLEKKGDKAGAKAAYQAIFDMEPASGLKSFAEERLKAL